MQQTFTRREWVMRVTIAVVVLLASSAAGVWLIFRALEVEPLVPPELTASATPAPSPTSPTPPTGTPQSPTVSPTPDGPAPDPLAGVVTAVDAGVDPADAAAVQRALRAALAEAGLSGSVSGYVVDAVTGTELFALAPDRPLLPASTAKIATGVAALRALGPEARLTTSVVLHAVDDETTEGGSRSAGVAEIVLVGGGDPTLTRDVVHPAYAASLDTLAAETAFALDGRAVRLRYDASLFGGPGTAAGWKPSYVTDGHVAPVVGLMVDGGRVELDERAREADPAAAAARHFAAALRATGVRVVGEPSATTVSAGEPIAQVQSPPVATLVERMLVTSDNVLAESLARHVALARGAGDDFAAAARAVDAELAALGVEGVRLTDGSGLSRTNSATARGLVTLLQLAASGEEPGLRVAANGLPVAGVTGTLAGRYDDDATDSGAGFVRAKTGSLNGVTTLAGVLTDADGGALLFAFLHNGDDSVLEVQQALDALTSALVTCDCR